MRVIAGSAKGKRLELVPGDGTRPITDRAKEALFSILQPDLVDARVLDLFAGTGSVGIEALSRGASHCDFNDRDAKALRTIHANLENTGLEARASVWRRDAFALLGAGPSQPYDLIYVAPPQYEGFWRQALEAIDSMPTWLTEEGIVVVQIHPREDEELRLEALEEYDRRRYAGVQLQFYGRRIDSDRGSETEAAPEESMP